MDFLTTDFNKKNEDLYNFRIVRVLKAVKRVSAPHPPLVPLSGDLWVQGSHASELSLV